MPNIDLHCHSHISDGLLSPSDLVSRAALQGVNILALTDHDDVAGLDEARATAREMHIELINGVEISVSWGSRTLHIVGLRIDPAHPELVEGLAGIRAGRMERARKIAAQLEARGIKGSLDGACALATNKGLISRTHFARFLVEQGYVKDVKTVFKKYLVKGKPGYVSHTWADLGAAVGWIRASGGMAVLAHPGRYGLSETQMCALLTEFKGLGGEGIEVVTGSHTPEQFVIFARLAAHFDLLASRGSDFHGPGESRFDLGRGPNLPTDCRPIWHDWPMAQT